MLDHERVREIEPRVVVRGHAGSGQRGGHAEMGLDQVAAVHRGVVRRTSGDEQDPATASHRPAHLLGPPAYLLERGRHRLGLLGDLAAHPSPGHERTLSVVGPTTRLDRETAQTQKIGLVRATIGSVDW